MIHRPTIYALLMLLFAAVGVCQEEEILPPVAEDLMGLSELEVTEKLGSARSVLRAGERTVLNYPRGSVELRGGAVTSAQGKFDHSEEELTYVPPSKTSLAAQAAIAEAGAAIGRLEWYRMWENAQAQSEKSGLPVLALFTGPDWCGPCMRLEREALLDKRFVEFVHGRFIPLKVALYRNTYQEPVEKEQYTRLSAKYGIRGVPAFVVIDESGNEIRRPDLQARYPGVSDLCELTIAAIGDGESSGGFGEGPLRSALMYGGGLLLVLILARFVIRQF